MKLLQFFLEQYIIGSVAYTNKQFFMASEVNNQP